MQVHLLRVVSITIICCRKEEGNKKMKPKKVKYVVAKETDSFDLATKPVKLVN